MKTKKIIIIIVCIVLAAFVFGATGILHLVNTSAYEAVSADRLIGVLITREYLDLFDSESESSQYQGKLYAALVETSEINDETGETVGRKEYVFKGIDGICHFVPKITDQFGTYRSPSYDDAITDGNVHINAMDEGESVSLEGTIFVSTRENAGNFYFNPVYQTPTGEVYAVSGDGTYFDNNSTAGMSISHEIKDDQSSSIGDLTTSSGSEIKITICNMDEPEKISILQFGKENEILSQSEYDPYGLPDTLQVQSGTQYIIVETVAFSQEQVRSITREIFQKQDDTLFAFSSRDDGICVKQECEIDWKN